MEIAFADNFEVAEYVSDLPRDNHSIKYKERSFCKYDWDQSLDALKFGWPQGAKEVLDFSEAINSKLDELLESYDIKYDVMGEFIDMGRYLVGEPECCGSIIAGTSFKPVVNIVADIAAICTTHQETMARRGGVIMSLIDNLRRDHIVKVHLYQRVRGMYSDKYASQPCTVLFGVTTASEYSRDLLAFYLAHPGALRRIVFGIEEKLFETPSLQNCSYGSMDQSFQLQLPAGEYAIRYGPLMGNDDRDFRDTESAVLGVIRRLDQLKKDIAGKERQDEPI